MIFPISTSHIARITGMPNFAWLIVRIFIVCNVLDFNDAMLPAVAEDVCVCVCVCVCVFSENSDLNSELNLLRQDSSPSTDTKKA
jgi:hypothetical protein